MKRLTITICALLLGSGAAYAQADVIDIQQATSSTEGQYVMQQQVAHQQQDQLTQRLESEPPKTEIPERLRKVLQKNDEYAGWEKSTYFDETTNLYKVEIKNGKRDKTYSFNEDGKLIIVTESIKKNDL